MRAIDFHVHLPTPDWLDASMAGYVEAAEAYFRSTVQRQSLGELAAKYRALDTKAVLLAWDAETATGRPRVPNETVAAACEQYPDAFTGIGSVDPHKGEAAVAEVANIAALGLRGVKFHPSLQAFAPDDPRYWPVFAACEEHGLLALFHTGTSGIGARQPGGQGIRIDYAHPLKLDPVAAAHPRLTVVAAHFGWPWHMDLIAVALHKTNVYLDISGWAPKRIPADVVHELKGRLAGQFVWGSDFPFFSPERCLADLGELGLATPALLHDNAARILRLPGVSDQPAAADHTDLVRRGYDALSYHYRADDGEGRYAPWLADLKARLPRNAAVLDIGCGCGVPVARVLAAAGHAVTGVDISEVQIERARGLVPAATFIQADASGIDFPEASFNAVISLYSLFHMPLDAQPRLLARAASWLRPGGWLLATTGAAAWTGIAENWLGGPAAMWWTHGDAATYRAWLQEAGLDIEAEAFVAEGNAGHALFWARRRSRP